MNPTASSQSAIKPGSPVEAVAVMLPRIDPVDTEKVRWDQAIGRVIAQPIVTDRPSPPADVSAMDGYAVRLADVRPGRLNVSASVLPGRPAPPLKAGAATRIMTGAVVPEGAEAVIPRELVEEHDDHIELSENCPIESGQHIRRRGENVAAGAEIASAGRLIDPAMIAGMVSFGIAEVTVYRRVRVSVIVTGDELLDPHEKAQPYQIHDSNGPALRAMFGVEPWAQIVNVLRVRDDLDTLRDAIAAALSESDGLMLSGGVSMGTHDFVPAALRDAGCSVVFHRVPIRPGQPLLAAVGPRGQAVMGLPGNPMSVMVTARWFGAALLRRAGGMEDPTPPRQMVALKEHDGKTIGIWWCRPVKLIGDVTAALVPSRGSGDLASIARSDGFVQMPPDAADIGPWPYYPWSL